jgi:hypothetical protein
VVGAEFYPLGRTWSALYSKHSPDSILIPQVHSTTFSGYVIGPRYAEIGRVDREEEKR